MVTTDGYFAPDGAARRVVREQVLMIGGGRALLMQAAHPLVAAGVMEHSAYREEPWRRLERHHERGLGDRLREPARGGRAAARVRAMHARVRGGRARQMGPFPAGTRYSAGDPELLLWVHGTLVDTALLVYEHLGPARCMASRRPTTRT